MSGFRAAFIVFAITVAGPAGSARAEEIPIVRQVAVAICDLEQLTPEQVGAAEQVAGDAYHDIGIGVDWINNGCNRGGLVVNVISRGMAGIDVSDYTLGYAESGTLDATVLYDRVHAFAHRYRVRYEVLLGYVIAHELAHLLLPPNSHSAVGLMRGTIDLEMASARRLRFTPEQGALITARLKGTSGYTAAARPQNCCDARRAPSAMAASLPQTTSGSTAAWPTHVP